MKTFLVGIAVAFSLAVVVAADSPAAQNVKTTGRGATLFASLKSSWSEGTGSGSDRKLLGNLASRLSYGHSHPKHVQERGQVAQRSGPDSWQYWGGGRDLNNRLWQRQPWSGGGGGWSSGGGGWSEDRWNRWDNSGSSWDNSGSSWDNSGSSWDNSGSWDNTGGSEDSWDRRRA